MRLLVKESPDVVVSDGKFSKRHNQPDARAFTIGDGWAIVSHNHKMKHHNFVFSIVGIFEDLDIEPKDAIDVDISSFKKRTKLESFDFVGNYDKFIKEFPTLKSLIPYMKTDASRSMGVITGRYWTQNPKTISFWAGDKQVKGNINAIKKGFKLFGLDIKNFSIDYLGINDQIPIPTYQEFISGKQKNTLTKKQIIDKMKAAHTDQKAKQELIDMGIMGKGQTKWERASQLTGMPVIKLKQMMTTSETKSMNLKQFIKD